MRMDLLGAKKFGFSRAPIAFGEPGAKQSQDDKPLTHQEPVRTGSVDYSLWSHLSLHSRRGREVSATWPLLTGLSSVLLVTARPFGLGYRSDEAPSGSGKLTKEPLRAKCFEPTREGACSLAHGAEAVKSRKAAA
jgi:hypothetical protein